MQIKKITTNAKNISFTAVYNADSDNVEATEERKTTCVEMPTPAFGEAMQALTMVVVEVLEVGSDWVNGMTITSFTLSHTKNNTASMQIVFTRQLGDLEKPHKMTTPMFRIDEPQDGDSGSLDIGGKLAGFCHKAVTEATLYAKGDRDQLTFEQFAEATGALTVEESDTLSLDA
jgi:hypothetical protein